MGSAAATFRSRTLASGASMTDTMAVVRLRADLAHQILVWMNDAFAKVDFDAPSIEVIEKLTLAWSEVLIQVEAVEQTPLAVTTLQASVNVSS